MNRNRWLVLLAVIGMVVPMAATPAVAWEFSMDGAFVWEYEFRTQSGKAGFFGPYDVDAGSTGGGVASYLAPANFWLGFHYPGNEVSATSGSSFASGADGSWNTIYMDTNMQIRMNQALRIRGRYHIGKWYTPGSPTTAGEPPASEYINYLAPSVQRSFSPGYWNTLWLTAEVPWGIVAMGKRASAWGTGLGWNGEENRSSESLAFIAPYGPLRMQLSLYPSRRGQASSMATGGYFNNDFDKNNARLWDMVVPSVTYRSGPIDTGFLFNIVARHTGREGFLGPWTNATGTGRQDYPSVDFDEFYGGVYFKYFNGRFFVNSEVNWDHSTSRQNRQTVATGQQLQPTATTWVIRNFYREHWRFMFQPGVVSGPAKVSLLYAWLSGPDRRNGAQIDRTGLNVDVGIRSNSWSNTGFFRPYSYLMVYSYGLGTHMNRDTTNGTAEDASIWAGRVDYAVASNLNVFGNFMWAERTNKSGYGWGFIRPNTTALGEIVWNDRGGATTNRRSNPFPTPAGTTYAPNIPDPSLGYEIGAGFDWKLLEDFVVNFTLSYWQPGKWFSYAMIDKSIPNWDLPNGGPFGWGVRPDRPIDAIYGIELKLTGTF